MAAKRKVWVCDPHRGGVKIPPTVQERVRRRIVAYAEKILFLRRIDLAERQGPALHSGAEVVDPDDVTASLGRFPSLENRPSRS